MAEHVFAIYRYVIKRFCTRTVEVWRNDSMKFSQLHRWVGISALMMLVTLAASAQRKLPSAEDILSVNGAQGKEFWIAIPPNEILPFPTTSLEIYVASAFDTEVEVFDAAGNRTYRRKVTAGEIRTLSDSRGETNWTWEVREYEQVVKKAVRLRSKQPISVYVLNGKVTTSDGYLAIPVSSWGKEHMVTTYYDFREIKPWANGFIVIAKEPTVLTISLRGEGELDAKTSGGKTLFSPPFQISLDEGDVYSIVGDGTTRGLFDLTGTTISSSAPVGLISFHQRTTMPNLLNNGNGRDHLCEMTPHMGTWGKKYVSVEYTRSGTNPQSRGDVFRVVAAEPNTKWTMKFYDKQTKTLLGQGGGVLAKKGEFADISQSAGPTVLTYGYSVWEADKPIFVMQYACSANFDGDTYHDPFMINVVPEEQFITSTIFQQPTDTKFSTHNLNLIVHADVNDPDYIDNLKSLELDDVPVWRHPASSAPTLLFNHMGNNLHWVQLKFGPNAESHRVKSNSKVKFGGYIYGYGAVDSYGWPAASGFKPTSTLDTMPPLITADSLCGDYNFEATELRNIPDPPLAEPGDSDQVETGIAIIDTVFGSNSYNYQLVLITDQNMPRDPSYKRFKYRWEVIEKSKDAFAIYYVQDWADNVTFDTVFYFADKLTFNPAPMKFGKLRLGDKKRMDLTVTNTSDGQVVLTDSKMLVGDYYSIVAGDLPPEDTLLAGESHTFTIEYDGRRETQNVESDFDLDTLILNTACGEFKVGLDGVAAIPCITVADFDAGTVGVGEQVCLTNGLKITNPGSDTLVITAITGYNGTNFTLSNPTDPALPIRVLPRGGFVMLKTVCFQRNDVGSDDINVTFANNGSGGANCVADSVSNWKGATQSPGPFIRGYDWSQRRVNTLHSALGRVGNSGTQSITLNDVTFTDGSKYWPAGSNDANYVFKIGRLLQNATPVTNVALSNGATVDVEVFFRPGAVQVYNQEIVPVWDNFTGTTAPAYLEGEGIIPTYASTGASMTCSETPDNVPSTRDLVITNNGSMDLTISSIVPAGGLPAGWAFTDPSPITLSFIPGQNVQRIPVTYTRPAGFAGGSTLTLDITHDAVPGNGLDSNTITPITAQQTFVVGSCSGPDIAVTDLDYGRQLANCDAPLLEFTISNTGGGSTPLEIRDITPVGADAAAFQVINIIDGAGAPATLPFFIEAQQTARVQVRFTPTEPNATPWADRTYAAQFRIMNYKQGDVDELKPDTYVNLAGVGFVIPITMNLTNSTGGTPLDPNKENPEITFTVAGNSTGSWQRADLTSFTATITYDTRSLAFTPGSVQTTALTNGWTIGNPVIAPVAGTDFSTWTFTANGVTPVSGNGNLFGFKATLLLGPDFTTEQNLAIALQKPCLVPSTSGSTTEIYGCALVQRVVNVGTTAFSFKPISPNPVVSTTAKVDFGIGIAAPTVIEVIDLEGRVVSRLVDQTLNVGEYTLEFPTSNLGNGVYMLRIQCLDYTETQRVVIAK